MPRREKLVQTGDERKFPVLDDIEETEPPWPESWRCENVSTGSCFHNTSGIHFSHNGNGLSGEPAFRERLTADDLDVDDTDEGILGCGRCTVRFGRIIRGTKKNIQVAVKRLEFDDVTKKRLVANEIKKLAEAQHHPNVIHFYDSFLYKSNQNVLVLEYMDGGSLQAFLEKSKRLTPEMLAYVNSQVLAGLVHLHNDKRMVHNDMKPQNVLYNHIGDVKLGDLGCATSLSSNVMPNDVDGTKMYWSPEKTGGEGYSTPSDIWSFGIMTIELTTSANPLEKELRDKPDILFSVASGGNYPEPRLEIKDHSQALCDFVEHCVRQDPTQRAQADHLLAHGFSKGAASQQDFREWLAKVELSPPEKVDAGCESTDNLTLAGSSSGYPL